MVRTADDHSPDLPLCTCIAVGSIKQFFDPLWHEIWRTGEEATHAEKRNAKAQSLPGLCQSIIRFKIAFMTRPNSR
jgi:hypothetical protein